jgi:hypothetical protein
MQSVLLPRLSVELVLDAIEHKSAISDPIGEPPRHGA